MKQLPKVPVQIYSLPVTGKFPALRSCKHTLNTFSKEGSLLSVSCLMTQAIKSNNPKINASSLLIIRIRCHCWFWFSDINTEEWILIKSYRKDFELRSNHFSRAGMDCYALLSLKQCPDTFQLALTCSSRFIISVIEYSAFKPSFSIFLALTFYRQNLG